MHIPRRKHERSRRRHTEEDEAAGVPNLLARSMRLGGISPSASTSYNKPDGMLVQKRWCPQRELMAFVKT